MSDFYIIFQTKSVEIPLIIAAYTSEGYGPGVNLVWCPYDIAARKALWRELSCPRIQQSLLNKLKT